jgi:hypothetical protein
MWSENRNPESLLDIAVRYDSYELPEAVRLLKLLAGKEVRELSQIGGILILNAKGIISFGPHGCIQHEANTTREVHCLGHDMY